jgi:hypothetical protein
MASTIDVPPAVDGSTIAPADYSQSGGARTKGARTPPDFGVPKYASQVVPKTATITTSSAEVVVAAAVTGETHHLMHIDIQVTAVPTACTATLRNVAAGATVHTFYLPGALGLAGAPYTYSPPLPGVLSGDWTVQLSSNLPTVIINTVYVTG